MRLGVLTTIFTLCAGSVFADSPEVTHVEAQKTGATWRFAVTLRHGDTGWDHYADGWGVYLEDGTELGYRVLQHPHEDEQPFTRSLDGVKIPAGVSSVVVVPHDKVHGKGDPFVVQLR